MDAHPVGKRTPRIDVHNLHRIGGCSKRRHGASHRHSIDQRYGFRLGVVRIERIIFVDGHLLVAVAVVGIQIIAVAGTVNVAIDVASEYLDVSARATVVLEVAVLVKHHVHVSRYVIAAVYVAVDVDVRIV